MEFKIGDKVVLKTSREIKGLLKRVIKNDILIITGKMAKGGFLVSDLLDKAVGIVRKSDIKIY